MKILLKSTLRKANFKALKEASVFLLNRETGPLFIALFRIEAGEERMEAGEERMYPVPVQPVDMVQRLLGLRGGGGAQECRRRGDQAG